MVLVIILITVGAVVGTISSFFGVGGGVIIVPTLLLIFPKIIPQVVVSSSLCIIFLNSIINVYNFRKIGKIPQKSFIIPVGLSVALGNFVGSKIGIYLEPILIKTIFATTLLLIALRTLLSTPKSPHDSNDQWKIRFSYPLLTKVSLFSIIAGIIAGITGIGGGAILIPMFVTLVHMPFSWIPVYANLAIFIGSFACILTYTLTPVNIEFFHDSPFHHFQIGHLNLGIVLLVFLGAFFSSKLGVKLSQKVPTVVSRRLFVALLLLVSLNMFRTILLP